MTQTLATTRKVGGSLVITIPAEVVQLEQLRENEIVEIQVKKKKINGFGVLKGIGKFTKEDRMKDRF